MSSERLHWEESASHKQPIILRAFPPAPESISSCLALAPLKMNAITEFSLVSLQQTLADSPNQVFREAQACPASSKRHQSISLGGCNAQDTHLSHLASASLAVLGMPE